MAQTDLAARLGVTGASVSRWETGGEPEKNKLPEIIAVLGLDRDEVLRGLGFEELFREEEKSVRAPADTDFRYKRPPGLTDKQWAKVRAETKAQIEYQIERASKER